MSEWKGNLNWEVGHFADLSNLQVYQVMKLRVDVFVVEQACIYPEIDEKDVLEDTLHMLGYPGGDSVRQLVAYARAMAPVAPNSAVTIGRVVTDAGFRGQGVAREMMHQLMTECRKSWPESDIALSAQVPVSSFYESLGFHIVSEEYIEDGIPHIDMVKSSP